MKIILISRIELKPGEKIVSIVSYQGYIVAVTDRGSIYKIIMDEL